jgi:hypothetical protein
MKIVKKRMTEPGVFGLRKHQFGNPLFQKNGIPLCLLMKILNATYTTTLQYNRVLGLILQSCFELLSKKPTSLF